MDYSTIYKNLNLNRRIVHYNRINNSNDRWKNQIQSNDSAAIWKAINWNGSFQENENVNKKPDEQEFVNHFENY